MKQNDLYYIGYGIVISSENKTQRQLMNSKAYKQLRACFLNEIVMESTKQVGDERPVLKNLIMKYQCFAKNVFVVPTLETLGGSLDEIKKNYREMSLVSHIVILNHPELSTITLQGQILIPHTDIIRRNELVAEVAAIKISNRGRKAVSPDAKFRKVFWAWQNFFIGTNDALKLLKCSTATLYAVSKDFMTNSAYFVLYDIEFNKYMEDYEDKPVRGITVDEEIKNIILTYQRNNTEWKTYEMDNVISFLKIKPKYINKDYIRLRLNFSQGKSAMATATKKYSKGTEYVKQLEEELQTM